MRRSGCEPPAQTMFIPRMWSDEVERIGKQRCTPEGYRLQSIGDFVGLLGLLMLLAAVVYQVIHSLLGQPRWPPLWLITIPFDFGLVGSILVRLSWQMAARKNFHYDYGRRESTWTEAGQMRRYTFSDWQHEAKRAESSAGEAQ